jgi:hypothetical protein
MRHSAMFGGDRAHQITIDLAWKGSGSPCESRRDEFRGTVQGGTVQDFGAVDEPWCTDRDRGDIREFVKRSARQQYKTVSCGEHPFFLITLFQPELSGDGTKAHPIIRALAAAAVAHGVAGSARVPG